MNALPLLRDVESTRAVTPSPGRLSQLAQYLADLRNIVQAQIAVRNKRVYLPSLFGHYSVNSACNLRCSYCYVGQPEIFPEGFTQKGLPVERAKRVLGNLRKECVGLRIQGGEPFLYKELTELVRFAKHDLRYWHVSIITNGLALERKPEKWRTLLDDLDLVTFSIDRTRLREYPDEMRRLTAFLPAMLEMAREHRVALTLNYTASWEDLSEPEGILDTIAPYRPFFSNIYIMPVRQAGKTPLPLIKNSVALNRQLSWIRSSLPDYPEVENVAWYQENCDPKLKIKIDSEGGLVYPCENHSYSAGSLETHTIRELWGRQLEKYPNESCVGCGKQRFRSYAMKHPAQFVSLTRRVARAHTETATRPGARTSSGAPPAPEYSTAPG